MRRLLIAALFLLAGPAWAVDTTYYVRTDGSNTTNCTGLANAAYDGSGTGEACALDTIQAAVNKASFCSNGDNVTIGAGTFSEVVTLPSVCQCPSAVNRCVIDGAGAGSTIVDPGAGQAAFIFGNTGSANRTKFVEWSNMTVKGGTDAAFYAEANSKYATNNYIHDVTVSSFSQMATQDSAVQMGFTFTNYSGCTQAAAIAGGDGNLIERMTLTGDGTNCASYIDATDGLRACGSRVFGVTGGGCGFIIRDSTFENMVGTIIRAANRAIIEGNTFSHTFGEGDDGAIQNYNTKDVIFRRNLVIHTATANQSFAFHRMRRTLGSGNSPSLASYNNTFVFENGDHGSGPTACTGTTNSCANNTCGSDCTTRTIYSRSDSSGTGPYGEFTVVNNIFLYWNAGTGTFAQVNIDDGGSPDICPSTCQVEGNVFFGGDDPIDKQTCTCTTQAETQEDPLLDASWEPTSGSPACDDAVSYTAWDGDEADMWSGALQGVCAGGGGSPATPGVKLYGAILRGGRIP